MDPRVYVTFLGILSLLYLTLKVLFSVNKGPVKCLSQALCLFVLFLLLLLWVSPEVCGFKVYEQYILLIYTFACVVLTLSEYKPSVEGSTTISEWLIPIAIGLICSKVLRSLVVASGGFRLVFGALVVVFVYTSFRLVFLYVKPSLPFLLDKKFMRVYLIFGGLGLLLEGFLRGSFNRWFVFSIFSFFSGVCILYSLAGPLFIWFIFSLLGIYLKLRGVMLDRLATSVISVESSTDGISVLKIKEALKPFGVRGGRVLDRRTVSLPFTPRRLVFDDANAGSKLPTFSRVGSETIKTFRSAKLLKKAGLGVVVLGTAATLVSLDAAGAESSKALMTPVDKSCEVVTLNRIEAFKRFPTSTFLPLEVQEALKGLKDRERSMRDLSQSIHSTKGVPLWRIQWNFKYVDTRVRSMELVSESQVFFEKTLEYSQDSEGKIIKKGVQTPR